MAQQYDILLFGATSFVGKLVIRYLLDYEKQAGESFSWAVAARSTEKFNAVLKELEKDYDLPEDGIKFFAADSFDEPALRELCEKSKVIMSTVGPFAKYGDLLVKLCAESGTHYCDLTGEGQWVAKMLAANETQAKQSGAKIVHCCGFDSIPFDLGVHFLQQSARSNFNEDCEQVSLRVKAMKGGFSGGTVASIIEVIDQVKQDPSLKKILTNPYFLCPQEARQKVRQKHIKRFEFDDKFKSWVAPFIMSAINIPIVQRSHALGNSEGSTPFYYDEGVLCGSGIAGFLRSVAAFSGLVGFMLALNSKLLRNFMQKKVLPLPGEGPTPRQQERGFYDLRLMGKTKTGKIVQAKVVGDRDPGYGSTAKMLSQAALCLAFDVDDRPGGFWTPASLMGDVLVQRLMKHAGVNFSVLENDKVMSSHPVSELPSN